MPTVMITGAGGFIGRRVTRQAESLGAPLRLLAHRSPVARDAPRVHSVSADLADPGSLRGICEGADILLHCASQIGGDAETCEAVNARGTAALVEEARRAGVSRIVYLSTASVYGRGTFRRARPEDLGRAPVSVTSRTRAAAEDAVLAAGGIVLRPHLVYGEGDKWVAPTLARVLRTLPGTVEGWPALVSAIAVDDLAHAVVAAGLAPAGRLTASVYHANHPRPVPWSALLRALAATAGIPWPEHDLSYPQACAALAERGRSAHDLDMMVTDHWFDSDPLWADLGRDPGPGFEDRFPEHTAWYRELLHTA
ncbi:MULTISPECIES: NAD-dependent epimerase/dehydratase family protein [unclassified Streptomyces]|uniref:NAD-dependent epimerase/dehydratase family protein n=1 Tax=unclassified Streptomyces TaxID=2593676 RepID=UPI00380B4EDE